VAERRGVCRADPEPCCPWKPSRLSLPQPRDGCPRPAHPPCHAPQNFVPTFCATTRDSMHRPEALTSRDCWDSLAVTDPTPRATLHNPKPTYAELRRRCCWHSEPRSKKSWAWTIATAKCSVARGALTDQNPNPSTRTRQPCRDVIHHVHQRSHDTARPTVLNG
jgi:hypothetical protein